MVFSGVSMSKDLGRGPMDLSPRVGGGKAPERPGDQRSSPYPTTPCGSDNRIRLILEWVVRPTRGRMVGVGRFLPPSHRLYEPRLGAMTRLTSHEGRSFMVSLF